jgi:hypothetical protein
VETLDLAVGKRLTTLSGKEVSCWTVTVSEQGFVLSGSSIIYIVHDHHKQIEGLICSRARNVFKLWEFQTGSELEPGAASK